jgi:UPF0755 protein
MPVDPGDLTPITVNIESGSSLSTISELLAKNGLIRSATVFKYYVDFTDRSSKLKAGDYQFAKAMTMDNIIDSLISGDGKPKVTYVTQREGGRTEDLGLSLVSSGILPESGTFLDLCRKGDSYAEDYSFIRDVMQTKDYKKRKYLLEGYLYPAKYEIYIDSSADTIIRKMLDEMNRTLTSEYYERCDELDMTMDQVITLASIIEKEASADDFKKVSAVFHNRLKDGMKLRSDVTVQYATGKNRLVLTAEDIATDSPYNTYKYAGLPIGPICSPSKKAIEAALYPDEKFIDENYLYFTLTDPETGVLAFSKTEEEHNTIVEQYRPLWEKYDKAHGLSN